MHFTTLLFGEYIVTRIHFLTHLILSPHRKHTVARVGSSQVFQPDELSIYEVLMLEVPLFSSYFIFAKGFVPSFYFCGTIRVAFKSSFFPEG